MTNNTISVDFCFKWNIPFCQFFFHKRNCFRKFKSQFRYFVKFSAPFYKFITHFFAFSLRHCRPAVKAKENSDVCRKVCYNYSGNRISAVIT